MGLSAVIFLIGYIIIALEHKVKADKAAVALMLGILLWLILAFGGSDLSENIIQLKEHFEEIAEILFFLLGAMTIVELIDTHDGFAVIRKKIGTKKKVKLLWLLSLLTFFLSSVLDNLTTTIVMIAIVKKFMDSNEDLWTFGGFIIIAANAGGAWSPIGDITTIMLWNGGQISSVAIINSVFLASLACLLVPLIIISSRFRGTLISDSVKKEPADKTIKSGESNFILVFGVALLLLVPIFKSITHLPPFMGMLFSLSVFWLIAEFIHRKKTTSEKHYFSVSATIKKIDTPSILFFLGILLAVAAMQTNGSLDILGKVLDNNFNNFYIINGLLGFISSIIDNVPLVAGAMGMYDMQLYPQDHQFWTFLAYCAGTGGSLLVIGSAAGIAAMGILKIDFLWYLKHIAWLALIGYLAGIVVYMIVKITPS
jgi:Na+/H+ antiporter NhaD/arsenite permease-like protein